MEHEVMLEEANSLSTIVHTGLIQEKDIHKQILVSIHKGSGLSFCVAFIQQQAFYSAFIVMDFI